MPLEFQSELSEVRGLPLCDSLMSEVVSLLPVVKDCLEDEGDTPATPVDQDSGSSPKPGSPVARISSAT